MQKIKTCPYCNGLGTITITACDICGSEDNVCKDNNDKYLCQECWGKSLTAEEINDL
jgi:RecJ-like exonuclease